MGINFPPEWVIDFLLRTFSIFPPRRGSGLYSSHVTKHVKPRPRLFVRWGGQSRVIKPLSSLSCIIARAVIIIWVFSVTYYRYHHHQHQHLSVIILSLCVFHLRHQREGGRARGRNIKNHVKTAHASADDGRSVIFVSLRKLIYVRFYHVQVCRNQ